MANILGHTEDPAHWNETVNFPHLEQTMKNGWELDTEGMYGSTSNGIGFSNVAPAANSLFPRDWVNIMAEQWLDNSVQICFFIPLSHFLLRTGERILWRRPTDEGGLARLGGERE